MAGVMVPLNRSLDVDIRLWPQDLRGSRVWAQALVKAGVLEKDEGVTLLEGLDRVATRLSERDHSDESAEDIRLVLEPKTGRVELEMRELLSKYDSFIKFSICKHSNAIDGCIILCADNNSHIAS